MESGRNHEKNGCFTVRIKRRDLWAIIISFIILCGLAVYLIVSENDDSMSAGAYIALTALAAFMMLGVVTGFSYKITVDGSKDHFVYRTAFFRTHIIKYSDCEYFKPSFRMGKSLKWMYMLKTKKKRFFIDETAENADRFFRLLKKNNVPLKYKDYSGAPEKDGLFEVTLGKGKTVSGIFLLLLFGFCGVIMISDVVFSVSDLFQGVAIDVKSFIIDVLFSLFSVLVIIRAVLFIITPFNFKIIVYNDSDSFDYRTAFNRTYTVLYKDCVSCKRSYFMDCYILKTKLKTFYIDEEAFNTQRFLNVLSRKKITTGE